MSAHTSILALGLLWATLVASPPAVAQEEAQIPACERLAQSIQGLEDSADPSAQPDQILLALRNRYALDCIGETEAEAGGELKWYGFDGKPLAGPDVSIPALATAPASAQACEGDARFSACTLAKDHERWQARRRARLSAGAMAAGLQNAGDDCGRMAGSLTEAAQAKRAEEAVSAFEALEHRCGDFLAAAAQKAGLALPVRRNGPISSSLFADSLRQSRPRDPAAGTLSSLRGGGGGWSVDEILTFGMAVTGIVAGLQQLQQARAARAASFSSVPMTNSSTCQQLLDMANRCRASQGSMRSLTPISPRGRSSGSGGQAGAFSDCYNNYINAYNATCR